MKVGRLLGLAVACCWVVSAADGTSTNRSSKWSGIFEGILNRALTNLTRTNVVANTNTPVFGTGTNVSFASIPASELSAGVKEAIGTGLWRAVASLGQTNGFLTNSLAHIPLPAQFAKVERMLRAVGQGPLVDDFVAAMNHAAEEAVPVATGVFTDSLTQMTIADARDLLLSNSKTAATEYFRKTTTNQLTEKFLPIVQQATAKTGVTAAYKDLLNKTPFGAALLGGSSFDVDHYVTGKALDGLFTLIGQEEIRIRENPEARVTALLQKVFGALPVTGIGGFPTGEIGRSKAP